MDYTTENLAVVGTRHPTRLGEQVLNAFQVL
jgi:predicted Rossmann fold nucleotide-binding protein DprA/Smf involved in DNA uptake